MAASAKSSSQLPDTSSQTVRQRWLDLLDLSYSTRRVTQQEIEPGIHAVVVPAACRKEANKDLVEIEVRVASSQVPAMARGVRLVARTPWRVRPDLARGLSRLDGRSGQRHRRG